MWYESGLAEYITATSSVLDDCMYIINSLAIAFH